MSICTCTPKQKESGRYGKRCTAHNGHMTSAYTERKRPHRAKTDATLPESSKLWRDTGEEQHKTIVRESIAAWIAARLPKDDSRVSAFTMEFMREIEVVLTSFTQWLSMSKPNRDQLFSACDLLNIPRPRWGKPADQKRAWKNRRAVLKSTHPNTLGHEGGLGAYHGITEEELRLVVVRAIHTLRQKEGDVVTMEAIGAAFMFATAAHPSGSTIKIKVSYPFVRTKKS